MKIKSYYLCSNCGYRSARWQGRCPSCEAWNSFVENVEKETSKSKGSLVTNESPILISKIEKVESHRIKTAINEFDRVLGGGIVSGSVILLGGDPGIGKSTILLQVSGKFKAGECLYVSGEESKQQISLRFNRLFDNNFDNKNDIEIYTETNLEAVLDALSKKSYQFVVIDSIQSIYSSQIDSLPGSILQIKECAFRLTEFAKSNNTAILLVGHITKEGSLAGPKVLEHIVDVVLQFEGDKNHTYRILRTLKNRFGSTNEIGIFDMKEKGLFEVTNPNEIFLSHIENLPGVVVSSSIEGTRPILVEVQALVTNSSYSYPQRNSNGFEMKRLQLILAVLEKKLGLNFSNRDVFINITGGLRVDDPAIDLAVALSIISSYTDIAIPNKTIVMGEIGLTGEVRAISQIDNRISEAQKLGFDSVIAPKSSKKNITNKKINQILVNTLNEAFSTIFK